MNDILQELSEARRKDAEARAKTLSVAELERRVAALPATTVAVDSKLSFTHLMPTQTPA